MKLSRWVLVGLLLVGSSCATARDYEADPSLYALMDAIAGGLTSDGLADLFAYNQDPATIYWPHTIAGASHITFYGPDTQLETVNRAIAAYQQGGQVLESLFQAGVPPRVKVFIVAALKSANVRAQATRVGGEYVILIQPAEYTEHSFLHEYMHILQRAVNAHPYASAMDAFLASAEDEAAWKWYVEGPPQFAPLITGAPDSWINKPLLYSSGIKGRFQQALSQAHGKSMVDRQELASLFWYYYFKKVVGGSPGALSSAMLAYRDHGFSNEGMSWFDFQEYWHDFALAHLNVPGDKTGVWEALDSNFGMVDGSARDHGEFVEMPVPFGDKVELKPLSQKYFVVDYLEEANEHVVFSLPDKEIPEDVRISAVLRRTDLPEETWAVVPIEEADLAEHGFMRFPLDGEKDLESDADIPYDKIIFVLSNASDSERRDLELVITNHLAKKYEGRGVELASGTKYVMTGASILGKPRKGDGYRLFVEDDEIHTRSLEAWFQREPLLEFDQGDALSRKALNYMRDNGVFRGDVYFKYIGLRPEKVKKIGGRTVEEGKLLVERQRKENFYDTPNLFKIKLDQEDLLIMFGGDVKAATAFTRKIENIVETKYRKGSFGGTLKQLFQQTMAIDTRAYNQAYEVNYKRGSDEKGKYLKIRLGESMWLVLRETELAGLKKIVH